MRHLERQIVQRDRDMLRLKLLAKKVVDERTTMQQFFIDALDQVVLKRALENQLNPRSKLRSKQLEKIMFNGRSKITAPEWQPLQLAIQRPLK